MNEKAKQALIELFGINEVQAVAIIKLYFNAKTPQDILGFKKYYDTTMLKKQFIGTSYEKLSYVCAFAELDLKLRYESIEYFLEWLFLSFTNRFFFQTHKGDFSFSYALKYYNGNMAYDEKGNPVLAHYVCDDAMYYINANKQLCDEQKRPLDAGQFYNVLVGYMFKNQDKIIYDNQVIIPTIKAKTIVEPLKENYEKSYLEYKQKQNKLYKANVDRYILKLEQVMKAKNEYSKQDKKDYNNEMPN